VVGELVARKANIQEHAVDPFEPDGIEYLGQIAEVGLREADGLAGEFAGGPFDRGRIAVNADHEPVGADRLGEQPHVAAAPERAVDHPHPGPDVEQGEHLGGEDGLVDAGTGRHDGTLP
jgi:hypothetical protein